MKKDKLINIRISGPGRRAIIKKAGKKGYAEMLLEPHKKLIEKAEKKTNDS